ncbi:hypothetical protein LCGC14_2932270 [marine sediment metagenome]|uniref:DUF2283 domain-containing protein n=1 Tax=marine sediment metagenome TaxID=412755 RepID=A0A0F8Y7J9_9ZZZZ
MEKEIKVWYDKEGDYLEVLFAQREGYFKETENDAVMSGNMNFPGVGWKGE